MDSKSPDLKKLDKMTDDRLVKRITRYRQNIVGLLKPEFIKKTLEELVEECKYLDWYNDRAKKHHDSSIKIRIRFYADIFEKFPDKEVEELLKSGKSLTYQENANGNYVEPEATNLLRYEKNIANQCIILPFTDILNQKEELLLSDNEQLKAERDSIFNEYPELKKHIKGYIVTTLFRMILDLKNNSIFIEFLY